MTQIAHINQRHTSSGGRSHVENMNPKHLPSHKQAGENDKVKEMTQPHDQSSKLDPPKFQEAALCFVSKVALAQEVKQRDSQEILTDCKQFMPNTPSDTHFPQEGLLFHRHYLQKRMEESQYTASRSELFKELHAKGYRGSIKTVGNFLSVIRQNQPFSKTNKTGLFSHKDYLKKRIRDTQSTASGYQLFKEIQAKGYRGSIKTVSNFLSTIRQNKPTPERYVALYKDYLLKRMKETGYRASRSELFKEIQAKGYRGSIKTVGNFLSMIRPNEQPPEASLTFHRDYLEEKLWGESQARHAPALELFKEIQARGYRGSISNLRNQLVVIRKEITLKKTRAKGYQGSIKTVQNFLTTTHRAQPAPEACLSFHKNDLIRKIKETLPHQITAAELFREIQAKGYRGSLRRVQQFVASIDCVEKNRVIDKT